MALLDHWNDSGLINHTISCKEHIAQSSRATIIYIIIFLDYFINTFLSSFLSFVAAKGSCGNGVQLSAGQADVKLDGKTFRNKPIDGVTIALWINTTSVKGLHYLFDTIGGHSTHKHDQYLLTMNNGAINWSHNDQNDKQLFKVTTDPIVTESKWLRFSFLS